jgi:hypothetical protein
MSRFDDLLGRTDSRPDPVEVACLLADDRFWRDERRRLIGTHPDWPDAAYYMDIEEALGHALVLVLSRLPAGSRPAFARAFFRQRGARRARWVEVDDVARAAAAVALSVAEIAAGTVDERMLDLLRGARRLLRREAHERGRLTSSIVAWMSNRRAPIATCAGRPSRSTKPIRGLALAYPATSPTSPVTSSG